MQFLNLRPEIYAFLRYTNFFLFFSLSSFFSFFYKIKRWNILGARINAIRRARSRRSRKWPRYPWRITDVARQESNFSISSSTHRLEATRHPLLSIFIIRVRIAEKSFSSFAYFAFHRFFLLRFPDRYLQNYCPPCYVRNAFE